MSILSVYVQYAAYASGFYELSAAEPLRNGRPHWIKQNSGPTYGTDICHLYYDPPQWRISFAPRGISEGNKATWLSFPELTGSVFELTYVHHPPSGWYNMNVAPACPVGTYAQGSGLATTCSPCEAYQFSPPGSTSQAACACAPGAGLVTVDGNSRCAPCTNNTYRGYPAANSACTPCPPGSFATDGAMLITACQVAKCDRITL